MVTNCHVINRVTFFVNDWSGVNLDFYLYAAIKNSIKLLFRFTVRLKLNSLLYIQICSISIKEQYKNNQ